MEDQRSAFLPKRQLAGLPITIADPAIASREIRRIAGRQSQGAAIHFVNAYSISLAERDSAYRAILESADHNFPDGKPLSWATIFSKARLHQVRGPQQFELVMDEGRTHRLSHFLLGGDEPTRLKLESELRRRYPGVLIVGGFSPPFRRLTETEQAEQDQLIRDSGANIVWVGLGTPKQDFETARLSASIPVVAAAVGAAFDFVAGTKATAPNWMTVVGLEWAFRLATEPRRLWKRYLIGNAIFVWSVIRPRA
jgi:N-acetylglucosaminyldiphosphoundecaprenol N-acetyl-beta-D-mannosaminyltransferase